MPAIFAQPTTDENLTPGWNVQGTGAANSPGPGAPGYGQAGNTTTSITTGQALAGLPQPTGALNTGAENSGSQTVSVLSNAGYADATGPATRTLPATIGGQSLSAPAVPATTVVAANPSASLAALVTITGGTLTVVKVGSNGQTYAQATQVGTTAGTYTVPPNGVIGITYSAAPTWTWAV